MEDASTQYNAVYHFRDEHLFEAFIAPIPRQNLLEHVRKDEALKTRHFPGFRVTDSFPTHRQILTAYKKEVVDRHNGKLASSLCVYWVAQRPALADVALKSLDIHASKPSDANSWIKDVQAKLDAEPHEDIFRRLVRKLAGQFSNDDIHIFASLISYGKDQQGLRSLIDQELLGADTDPTIQKERIEADLHVATAKIEELKKLGGALKAQRQSESSRTQEDLNVLLQQHIELTNRLVKDEFAVQTLTDQLNQIKKQLAEQQHTRDATETQGNKLSKDIFRKRKELSDTQTAYDKQIEEASGSLDFQLNHVSTLATSLKAVKAQLLAEQHPKAEPVTAPVQTIDDTQPALTIHASRPTAVPTAATSQPQPTSSDGLGNNAICYQGVQRIFRNCVVAFLRDRMTRLYPEDHIHRLKKSFGDEWDKGALNAALSRENLGTSTAVRDEYDLLGTNHFYNVFNGVYERLFTAEAGQPPDLPRPVKPRFLGNLKAIKDARDPLSHPVEEEISTEEAQHILYAAQEVLKWLACYEQAKELADLAASLSNREVDGTTLLRRLPSEDSIYLEWVGRDSLLKDLTDCFANPDGKRCLLAGDGGKGKSAAAYRFVQSIPSQAGRYHLVIWLSAKRRRFREGMPTTIESPDFTTAAEAIDRLLTEYGATAQDMSKDVPEKKRLLFEYLNEFPAFIVADDIDTVLEDDEVVSLFTHEIPHTQSSVLATSRRAIPGIRSFIVPGFDPSEAEEFVKSRIRLYSLRTADFTPSVIKDIARTTDGLPLYMDDLMRLTKVVDIRTAIRVWTEKGGDEARKYALQREVEKLSLDAKKCLIAAAVTDEPISLAELESIVELSEDRLVSALTELQTLFLFPKAPAVEGEQRYQININTKKLIRLVEGSSEFYTRIDNRSKAVSGKLPDAGRGVVGSLIRQALLRVNAGQHSEAEAILIRAIEKYPNSADLHGILGYVYRRVGRVADARTEFEAAFKLKSTNREMFLQWQRMEIAEKEWSKALAVAERAIKVLPDAYEIIERKVYTLRRAGIELYPGLHYEKATKMLTEAVEEVNRRIKSPETLPTGARALNASMYCSVVISLDKLNRLKERSHWLERWEKEHPDDPQVAVQKEFFKRKRGVL